MKIEKKIYLEPSDWKKLKEKAERSGFTGKGMLSHYIGKVAKENLFFLTEDVRSIIKLLEPLLLKSLNLK